MELFKFLGRGQFCGLRFFWLIDGDDKFVDASVFSFSLKVNFKNFFVEDVNSWEGVPTNEPP